MDRALVAGGRLDPGLVERIADIVLAGLGSRAAVPPAQTDERRGHLKPLDSLDDEIRPGHVRAGSLTPGTVRRS